MQHVVAAIDRASRQPASCVRSAVKNESAISRRRAALAQHRAAHPCSCPDDARWSAPSWPAASSCRMVCTPIKPRPAGDQNDASAIAFRQLVGHGNHAAGPVKPASGSLGTLAQQEMKFETGMENNTTADVDEPECAGCAPDRVALADFQRAIHAISGKWKRTSFHADERRDAVRCPAPVACRHHAAHADGATARTRK